ncbi:MAG: hypothetical protein JXA96_11375 [Sedimentisphaerales bacterium]|nr:hypothetical protein [Sedimentisphaerales bacterium]
MSYSKKIKNLFTQSNIKVNNQVNDRIIKDSLKALDESHILQPSEIEIETWRIIMRKPITKIAIAAIIIMAVFMSVNYFGGSVDIATVAWGGVLDKVEQIPTVIFDMTAEITISEDEKLVLPSKNYVAEGIGTRSDIYLNSQLSIIKYRLPMEKAAYEIRLDRKEYSRFEIQDEQASDDPRVWLEMILSGDYTELGRNTINNIVVEGISVIRPDIVGEKGIMRLWVDVQTNLPVMIEVEMVGMEAGQMRQQRFVMENFEWNTEIDPDIFVPDIPEDFTQRKIR